ncbi:hypothetical protein B0H11DRAFT_2402645 [Mycena galericulata]|nr:hypothetical protein B0H11DRAFT_2402645 [Mycena galericulata]
MSALRVPSECTSDATRLRGISQVSSFEFLDSVDSPKTCSLATHVRLWCLRRSPCSLSRTAVNGVARCTHCVQRFLALAPCDAHAPVRTRHISCVDYQPLHRNPVRAACAGVSVTMVKLASSNQTTRAAATECPYALCCNARARHEGLDFAQRFAPSFRCLDFSEYGEQAPRQLTGGWRTRPPNPVVLTMPKRARDGATWLRLTSRMDPPKLDRACADGEGKILTYARASFSQEWEPRAMTAELYARALCRPGAMRSHYRSLLSCAVPPHATEDLVRERRQRPITPALFAPMQTCSLGESRDRESRDGVAHSQMLYFDMARNNPRPLVQPSPGSWASTTPGQRRRRGAWTGYRCMHARARASRSSTAKSSITEAEMGTLLRGDPADETIDGSSHATCWSEQPRGFNRQRAWKRTLPAAQLFYTPASPLSSHFAFPARSTAPSGMASGTGIPHPATSHGRSLA